MSNVSGSAAGSPSGTTVPVTLAQQEHVFPEPTDPAPKKYVTWLIIAQFVFFVALLGPAVVGIGLKIQALQASGAIENSAYGFNTASAILGGVGAFFGAFANVVFGRLSDRTASKWGRRRPWILGGAVVMLLGFVVMAFAPSLWLTTVGWAIAQAGANMTLGPYNATIADHVPKFQRGQVTAAVGIAVNVGILGGVYIAGYFSYSMFIVFVLPAVLAVVLMFIFVLNLPDKVLPAKPPAMRLSEWVQTFWVSPRKHPDYALAWWSRFLIVFAMFGFTAFRFSYLKYHLHVPEEEVGKLIANTTLVYTAALVLTAYFAGRWSDKSGRRKIFVWTSTGGFALATLALIFVQDVPQFYVLELIMGAAYGVYMGVDLALVIDVLPNPDDAGKDLGVFNMASALPQTAAPLVGGLVLAATAGASGEDYTTWFVVCAVACLIGALVILPIKRAR